MKELTTLTEAKVLELMSSPASLHRFAPTMSKLFCSTIKRISSVYSGDAANIWKGNPSSATVVYRFLQFKDIGPKLATMATNILARDFKIPFSDYYSIDVSPDVHVRRVFTRLGLCQIDASIEEIIYKARSLYPQFPGLFDYPCFEIGRSWCRPRNPNCQDCYLMDLCPSAG